MIETTQPRQQTVDGLPVDTGTRYKLDAGQCKECGQYKTWGFKVQNEKTGKMMPGHVTAEGFKIGEGDCPKWARIAAANRKRAEQRAVGAAGAGAAPPARPGAWIQEVAGSGAVASAAGPPQAAPSPAAVPEPGPVVAFTVNGFTVTTSVTQAAAVVEQIGAAMRKILGGGA
ncbi:MAG: hypothetical protein JW839_00290 [Candidatus Lokiarchaeota archaeon]|nr:hypothetical protein [Candidatus Lokiarchaeota archaeon]